MDIVIWIASGLLALVFLLAGAMKIARTKEQLAASGMGWTENFSGGWVKLIGAAEVLGAVGVLVGGLVPVLAWAAPAASFGLAVIMVGAIVTHARRKEWSMIAINAILLALALFVAIARLAS
ncbi:putative membrane protein YphA (DoxX/SURF4 family) [Pseudarthrobacter oxydans]|uniref:Membrane protein YphA (DoxX/SURF4 family) n=1 Tax=Pseudarthrobacter oxydans TaxID=1671 RepID=A0AAW8NFP7_PSEOX|nr:DoxX family protein [Pseudarthrobacter oxydans]MBU3994183.1 DoxX family protein [Actinomycetota bacterium]MDR7165729.1 putative membrane protein YphA (DoxX/SURF4 family) [Pseudarthrobacter oxydans]